MLTILDTPGTFDESKRTHERVLYHLNECISTQSRKTLETKRLIGKTTQTISDLENDSRVVCTKAVVLHLDCIRTVLDFTECRDTTFKFRDGLKNP